MNEQTIDERSTAIWVDRIELNLRRMWSNEAHLVERGLGLIWAGLIYWVRQRLGGLIDLGTVDCWERGRTSSRTAHQLITG